MPESFWLIAAGSALAADLAFAFTIRLVRANRTINRILKEN